MNTIRLLNRPHTYDPQNPDFEPPHRHIALAPILDPEENYLPNFTALLYISILEDLIMKLDILSQINNKLKIEKTMADMEVLRSLKYSVKQAECTAIETIDPLKIDAPEFQLKKLDEDRNYLMKVLMETYEDITKYRKFQPLSKYVADRSHRDTYNVKLVEDERANKLRRRELYKQLRTLRNQHKAVLLDTNQLIEDLKIQVEDESLRTAIRERYTERWESARNEQHQQLISDAQSKPAIAGDQLKMRLEAEQRAHIEIEMLTNIRINELVEQLSHWMAKFDKDMEAVDLKIQIKRIDYSDMKSKRVELEEKYMKHENIMKNWIKFKEDREKARQYHLKMQNAATTVQSWWRGIIVRNNLGPFRVAKKKGKKGRK